MQPDRYQYIHAPDDEHMPSVVLDNYYALDDLRGRMIVRIPSERHSYHVYPTHEDFIHAYANMPEPRLAHEVIFDLPQKLKFDIDADMDKLNVIAAEMQTGPDELYQRVVDELCAVIQDAFMLNWDMECRVIVCDSSGAEKKSCHVIIPGFCVADSAQARAFSMQIHDYLPDYCARLVDWQVNKRIQCFRIVGSQSKGRTLLLPDGVNFADTLITYTEGCHALGADRAAMGHALRVPEFGQRPTNIQPRFNLADVLDICARNGLMNDHKFRAHRGDTLLFWRLRASMCDLCNEMHTADNTVIVKVTQETRGQDVVLVVRRFCFKQKKYGAQGSVILGEIKVSAADFVPSDYLRNIVAAPMRPRITLFDSLAMKTEYDEPALRPFELAPTLVVHAAMKMGKTKALRQFIDRHFGMARVTAMDGALAAPMIQPVAQVNQPLRPLRAPIIRMVSFRQTFSGNIKEKFPEFTLYSDVQGMLHHDRLIVQVESLHRLDIQPGAEVPDLLVLDECESIFEQFDSGLLRQFNDCFAKFQYLMRYSRHVVCADANISNRTYRILAQMRPGHAIHYHHNMHQNATEDNYYFTNDKSKWLNLLYTYVACERVVVPISSLEEAKALERILRAKFPAKSVKLYCSETPMSERKTHFADVNAHWAAYDVLIYTPTVSAGVSFELAHFDKIFGFFTDQSCTVETCAQMIGRIRNVRDKAYYIYVSCHRSCLPETVEAIKAQVYRRRDNLFTQFDTTGLVPTYGPDGQVHYYEGDYFHLWLENTLVRNLSRNHFARRFIDMCRQSGAGAHYLDDNTYAQHMGDEQDAEVVRDIIATKRELREETATSIAQAPDITVEEAGQIRDLHRAGADVSRAQVAALTRFRLRRDYDFHGPMNAKFVETYNKPEVRRAYKNLLRLRCAPTIDQALRAIQDCESAYYTEAMKYDSSTDISRRYVFDQHRYAVGMLRLLGWQSPMDCMQIHARELVPRIDSVQYRRALAETCQEFGIRCPTIGHAGQDIGAWSAYIGASIKPVNEILRIMYAGRIKNSKAEPMIFTLRQSSLFTDNVDLQNKKPLLRKEV